MRSIAITTAVIAFFAAAILSYTAACRPDICCLRGIACAAAMYLIVSWAIQIMQNIVIKTVLQEQSQRQDNNVSTSDK
jgi:hypothetical protein